MKWLKKELHLLALKFGIISELFRFLWKNKLWWAVPIVILILFFMTILMFAQGSGIAPFIYPLF